MLTTKLYINTKGKLIWLRYNPKTQKYIHKNVSKKMINFFNEDCSLEAGVTLRQLFELMLPDIEIIDKIFTNWTKDIVLQALKIKKNKKHILKNEDDSLDFIELYWFGERNTQWDYSTDTEIPTQYVLEGLKFPSLHGIGTCNESNHSYYKLGDRIQYSLSLTKIDEILDLPIVLNTSLKIVDNELPTAKVIDMGHKNMTLENILYGVIYELSFYGSPETKDIKQQEMKQYLTNVTASLSKSSKSFKKALKTKKTKKIKK